jgi:hypothetical protein
VAAVLRLLWLDTLPPGLHYDEAAYGLQAAELRRNPRIEVFFPAFTGREPLFIYLVAGAFAAFGESIPVLRGVAALAGVGAIAATALAGRALFGTAVGLLGAGLLAASFWHVLISRMAYRADLVPLVAPLAIWLLWRAWERPSALRAALAGLAWGVLAYTYVTVRLLPLALVLFALGELVAGPLRTRARLKAALVFLAVAAVVAAPLAAYFAAHPSDFATRFSQTSTIASESGGPAAASILDGILATLRMYGLRGDALQKYNLPLRPAIDPVLSAFLAIGAGVLVVRIRESRARLMLFWLIASLAPGFVTADSPNFLRLIGAAPPSYLVVALGAYTLGSLLLRRWPRAAAVAGVALVVVQAGLTARAYFGDWGVSPSTYYALDGDLADLGRLAAREAPGGPIYGSSEHYKHPTVAFTAGPAFETLRWFDGRAALPIAPAAARYLFPRSAWPRDPNQVGRVEDRRLDPLGEISAAVFARDASPFPAPAQATDIGFALDDGRAVARLVGIDPPLWPGRAGNSIAQRTLWLLEADAPPLPLDFFAHAIDAEGRRWGQRDASPYLTSEWRRGEMLMVWLDVPLNPTAPAGSYRLRLGLGDSARGRSLPIRAREGAPPPPEVLTQEFAVAHAAARPAGEAVEAFARAVPGGAAVLRAPEATFGPVRLLSIAAPPRLTAGDSSTIDLLWRAERDAPAGPAELVLRPSGGGAERSLSSRSLESLDPTTPWLAGEVQRDVRRFAPTRGDAGTWSLVVRTAGAELVAGQVEVTAPPIQSTPVNPQRAADGQLGDLARLVGFDVLDGRVRLYWQALGAGAENYTVFVHALDASDRIVAQSDAQPAGGARPTRGWAAGETIVDEHPLRLPPETRALAVGLYDARTGQRLPVRGGGDRLVLPLG